ncbi:coenzyme F420 hydrogenase [Sphingomonas piscis]|uniref:Coenzyme F420 hydrogenase n=2 Tax=Sphingomonas piscis TaxID=2714943 RepID=A0A6G7YTN1_9SPHN|nr:coenzyme F420 hydrogenase [Sphingomonas piscis]
MDWDRFGQLKPRGPADWYAARTEAFSRQCPFGTLATNEDELAADRFATAAVRDPRIGSFEQAYVGAAKDPYRAEGSSGGMVSWVASALLASGRVDSVAHVEPADPGSGGLFHFRLSRTREEVSGGAKSRYYPVHLTEVIRTIRETPGRYAIVGVPCFIKAVHLLRRADPVLEDRITHTLGLFCGHMKSAAFVQSFAWQLDTAMDEVAAVDYRIKDQGRPANWYRAHLTLKDGSSRAEDWWHLVDGDWGAGFFQNNACNYCDDVVAETADISFGDAWLEPYSSDGRGTNVVVARTPEMRDLLNSGAATRSLELASVDADFIVQTQAAGLRHRREGLAYRLRFMPPALPLQKRVAPSSAGIDRRRKLVFRSRAWIAHWSHRMAYAARRTGLPCVYTAWARASLTAYRGLTYSIGPLGRWFDRLFPKSTA